MTKKIFSHISKALIVAVALFLCAILFLNIFTLVSAERIKKGETITSGYSLAIVSSGSMAPTINKNDLIIIKGSAEYALDDIATYVSYKGSLITHRIVEISDSGFILQGDANNTPDSEIQQQRFLGKIAFAIPNIGGILNVLSSPIGIAFIIVFPAGIILLTHFIRKMNSE